jgi:hypothetical protein
MQKWEYCALGPIKGLDGDGLKGYYPTLVVFGPGGASHPYGKMTGGNEQFTLASTVARLGLEGWELVATGPLPFSNAGDHHTLYFKRLIE